MRSRVWSIVVVTVLVALASCVAVVAPSRAAETGPGAAGVVCTPGYGAVMVATQRTGAVEQARSVPDAGLLGFFTGGGSYMPRVDCMVTAEGRPDWPWVYALIALNLVVIAGYARIFIFWRAAYMRERPEDRNRKLMQLAWIFLWCAICGYAASILVFVWPAYRLVAFLLVPLGYFTLRFCVNLDELSVSLSAKRLERELTEALRARNDELEHAVAERTRELEEAREAAEAANRAKSMFVASISHEIRTPLNALLGYSAVLAEEEMGERQRRECVGTIHRNGLHLLTVINDVLDISKIESGQMAVERTACRPLQIARDVVELMEQRAGAKRIDLEVVIDASVPELIESDATRLRQILLNLVGNAIKFTEQGSVTIEMRAEDSGSRGGHGQLVVRVRDTGIGMTAEQAERVFLPFTQAEPGTTRRFGGTGLGLSISRSLAELLGGSLEVTQTEPGVGSTFELRVRADVIKGSPAVAADDAAPAEEPMRLSGRVLVVDDSIDNRRLLLHHLRRVGLAVEQAENGLEAVEAALASSFDLILMDVDMPVCDGVEALRRLRAGGYTAPIVALTAHALSGAREHFLGLGFDDYAGKPVSRETLRGVCRAWIANDERRAA